MRWVWLTFALALVITSSSATAQLTDRLDPVRVDMRWDAVPWGGSLEEVREYVKRSLDAQSRTALAGTLDQHQRDQIRQDIVAAAKSFGESVIAFTGQKTGYNLSVVNVDFAHECNESMAMLSIGKATDYFFFESGKLWKIVTTDASTAPFAALLVELTAQYGAPPEMTHRDPQTKTEPLSASWTSPIFRVESAAQPDYATRVIRWTWRPLGDKIEALRAGKTPPGLARQEAFNPDILDIMSP